MTNSTDALLGQILSLDKQNAMKKNSDNENLLWSEEQTNTKMN